MSKILKNHQVKIIDPFQPGDDSDNIDNEGGSISRRLAEGIILEAEFNAQEINKKALIEAKTVLEDAQAKVQEAIKEQENIGYQKGYEAGIQKGLVEGFASWTDLLKSTDKAMEDLDKKLLRWQETLSMEVIELSKEIAKRIVGAELEVKPEVIMQRITQAVKQIVNVKEMIIKISPADLTMVEKAKDDLVDLAGGLTQLRIVGSEDLKRGDFVLETDMGGIDGRVDTQLELMRKELVERWQEDGRTKV